MKTAAIILLILCCYSFNAAAQKEDRVWVFDDSIAIDWNDTLNPIVYKIGTTQCFDENYASICSKNGDLRFYIGGSSQNFNTYMFSSIYGANNYKVQNGDSIRSHRSITQGMLFLPFLNDTNKYYLFYLSFESPYYTGNGLYYSIIDKSIDTFGSVIVKNVLVDSTTFTEKMTAVKHGNGEDWWIVVHKDNSNQFFKFLLTPSGLSGPFIQTIGPILTGNSQGQMKFSPNGNKLGLVSIQGNKIAMFDFNRCTGQISNYQNLGNHKSYGCSFSLNGHIFYAATNTMNSIGLGIDSLFQFNLDSVNISQTKYLVWVSNNDSFHIGQLLLSPNNKIYFGTQYSFIDPTYHSFNNMNFSFINNPDIYGSGCNIQPHSFNLNGRISMAGLPNMINYNLSALDDSPCDTLGLGINGIEAVPYPLLNIYPNPASDELTIEVLNGIAPKEIEIINSLGVTVMKLKQTKPNQQVNIKSLAAGVYFVKVRMKDGSVTVRKFVKQ